ncbi:polysaccharide biosynthesis/export family protein [Candidatus Zixiibacteriota bacterium]
MKYVYNCVELVIVIIVLVGLAEVGRAEEYEIGAGDMLQISYWQQPELDQVATVRDDGKITLAIIGETQAAGLTTARLEQLIVERISRVNKNISQVVITTLQYRSRNIFVGGHVANPGLLYFETIPDLWEVIKLAGGPTEEADLSEVTLLRSAEDGGGVVRVDIAEILATGELDRLPKLASGYSVTVARLPLGLLPERFADSTKRKKAFYIYGSVAAPGRHAMESEIDLLEALVICGGPGPGADLSKVRIVSKGIDHPVVRVVDLERYGATGGPYLYHIQREDAIFIPTKKRGFFSGTWGVVRDALALGGTLSSLILILTR